LQKFLAAKYDILLAVEGSKPDLLTLQIKAGSLKPGAARGTSDCIVFPVYESNLK